MAKAKKRGARRRIGLAAFLRRLWSKPDLMERFSSGREGRAQVLAMFNLAPRHRTILEEGCVRDLVIELAGFKGPTIRDTTVVNDADEVECGHAECKAFMAALKPR